MCWMNCSVYVCYKLQKKKKKKKIVNKDEAKYNTFYWNSKAETIIHDLDIGNVFESIYSMIVTKIHKYQAEAGVGLLIQW